MPLEEGFQSRPTVYRHIVGDLFLKSLLEAVIIESCCYLTKGKCYFKWNLHLCFFNVFCVMCSFTVLQRAQGHYSGRVALLQSLANQKGRRNVLQDRNLM